MAITIDDFSKIWASTSPLTPYDFDENNYKQGWNFVGATPPSRQMWDSIQKSNDEKSKYLWDNFADYLPLAGGTMAGAIVGNPLTLSADDGNDSADLVLNSSGSATWNGKEVERVNASGTGYIRYESGLQICWGTASGSGDASGKTVTFPVTFNASPSVQVTSAKNTTTTNPVNIQINSYTTNFIFYISINGTWTTGNVNWFAVGYWK